MVPTISPSTTCIYIKKGVYSIGKETFLESFVITSEGLSIVV